MRGPPVVLTNTLGRPVTNIISERGAVPMTVVNTLGEPVTLVNSGGEPVTLFNPNGTLWDLPFSLFSNNEQGAWYDPSDFSTLYQTSTGTTPVTAVEQPVGLMLDRSRGLVLGSELVSNPGPFVNTTGWTGLNGALSVVSGNLRLTQTVDNYFLARFSLTGLTVGRTYRVTINFVSALNCTNTQIWVGTATNAEDLLFDRNSAAVGTVTAVFRAGATSRVLEIVGTATSGTISSVLDIGSATVRELPGTHASQATSASRPVLRARYNLLTYSEQFDNAGWIKADTTITANTIAAPDGTTTADTIAASTTGNYRYAYQTLTLTNGTTYTLTAYFKFKIATYVWLLGETSGDVFGLFNISNGTLGAASAGVTTSITALANGWYRCAMTFTVSSATASQQIGFGVADSNNASIPPAAAGADAYVWGIDLKTAADQTATGGAYQRIAAATDYDTSNPVFRPYLAFDGTDDSFSTSSIDFSGTDEMTVFAGVTKLSDAATGTFAELTISSSVTPGGIGLFTNINGYRVRSGGSALIDASTTNLPSPATTVSTVLGDIGSDILTLRTNGAVDTTSSADQGTGNYANAAFFIGRRNNASLPLNGRIYSLAVLGRTATAAELTAMEAWVAGKTGVTL